MTITITTFGTLVNVQDTDDNKLYIEAEHDVQQLANDIKMYIANNGITHAHDSRLVLQAEILGKRIIKLSK